MYPAFFFLIQNFSALDGLGWVGLLWMFDLEATLLLTCICWFQVWLDLLREMVLKLPQEANLASYRALCNDDAEQDFFYNIVHLQVKFLPVLWKIAL